MLAVAAAVSAARSSLLARLCMRFSPSRRNRSAAAAARPVAWTIVRGGPRLTPRTVAPAAGDLLSPRRPARARTAPIPRLLPLFAGRAAASVHVGTVGRRGRGQFDNVVDSGTRILRVARKAVKALTGSELTALSTEGRTQHSRGGVSVRAPAVRQTSGA